MFSRTWFVPAFTPSPRALSRSAFSTFPSVCSTSAQNGPHGSGIMVLSGVALALSKRYKGAVVCRARQAPGAHCLFISFDCPPVTPPCWWVGKRVEETKRENENTEDNRVDTDVAFRLYFCRVMYFHDSLPVCHQSSLMVYAKY